MARWSEIEVTVHVGDAEIDGIGVFHAYTRGERWNGFATPFFTRAEGQRVSEWSAAMARKFGRDSVETVVWDDALASFVLESSEYLHEVGEPIPREDIVVGMEHERLGESVYGIGAYRWTWEEVKSASNAE
jgi:hypothetical protein